ncbi:MAG: hypothetical protein ABSF99_04415 [Anaerolineales bacterium]|jgi:hypothetical protein
MDNIQRRLHENGEPEALPHAATSNYGRGNTRPNMRFGVLERYHAIGDYEAFASRNPRVLRLHLNLPDLLANLVKAVK